MHFAFESAENQMNQYSKSELEKLLKSDNKNEVINALMYLCFNINDPEWILEKCIEVIECGNDEEIRGLGITCIGHVARIYSKINKKKIIPFLNNLLLDKSISGRVQDALDDIETFAK